jgi:beta-glucosidase
VGDARQTAETTAWHAETIDRQKEHPMSAEETANPADFVVGAGGEPYRDASLSIEVRVADLLARMELDEKLAQLGGAWITALLDDGAFSTERAGEVAPHGIGEVTRISGATGLRPLQSAALVNELQRYFIEETRLGIPALVHEEGLGGFLARDATVFPQAIALASSFDPDLVEEVAATIRQQMLAVGARHCLAPVLDVARDPRWGRVEETFGEDPVLAAVLGVAYVRGLQGEDLTRGVLATGKHFIGHALPEGGRNHAPVHLGPRELREVYAEPFAAAIAQAGLGSVMNSYSSVDGLACAGSRQILTELLRDELGFDGMVVADYFAVSLLVTHHHVASDKKQAAVRALCAGLDVELPATSCFGEPLHEAVTRGEVTLGAVDTAVARVLRAKFSLGLFEQPYVEVASAPLAFETPRQRALARRAAAESIVLLRNDGLLPLTASARRIAVLGPGADDPRLLQGDYHYPAHLQTQWAAADDVERVGAFAPGGDATVGASAPAAAGVWAAGAYYTEHVTPLEGLRQLVGEGVELTHAGGCAVTGEDREGIPEAVRLAAEADVAVVVVAGRSGMDPSSTVGEARDASYLELTGLQEELVEAVVATGTPTAVVVLSGRAHALCRVDRLARALLQAWPLGEEGGVALAEVLLGRVNPSGRLPVSLPRTAGVVPRYTGHRYGGSVSMFYGDYTDGPASPLYPFGHGLSYTAFSYGALVVSAFDTTSPVRLEVEVANSGERSGEEVVQLYVSDLVASVVRPEQQLVGFARVGLDPGQSARLVFEVHPSRLGFYDEQMRRVTEPGEFRFAVGASSADLRATAAVELAGEVVAYPITAVVPTAVRFLDRA